MGDICMIIVIGDVHGRLVWDDIVSKHPDADKVIFLGDYVSSHEDISAEQQLSNLEDILNYKEDNPDRVILLRGNHDEQFCGYSWAACSGFDRNVYKGFPKQRFEELTQWIYLYNDIIFSHAGISQKWLDWSKLTLDTINSEPPSEKFAFNGGPYDFYGTSPSQPLTWIRPQTLIHYAIKGYTQVVGHTPVNKIFNTKDYDGGPENIWLCDCLGSGQYLVINNNEFIPSKLEC